MLACGPLLLGELLLTSAWHFWVLVAGRLLVGVGIGLTSYLVPVYISEVCFCPPAMWQSLKALQDSSARHRLSVSQHGFCMLLV